MNLNSVFAYSVIEEGGSKDSFTKMSILSTVLGHSTTLIFILIFFSQLIIQSQLSTRQYKGSNIGKK